MNVHIEDRSSISWNTSIRPPNPTIEFLLIFIFIINWWMGWHGRRSGDSVWLRCQCSVVVWIDTNFRCNAWYKLLLSPRGIREVPRTTDSWGTPLEAASLICHSAVCLTHSSFLDFVGVHPSWLHVFLVFMLALTAGWDILTTVFSLSLCPCIILLWGGMNEIEASPCGYCS